jgi:hypothetical protein
VTTSEVSLAAWPIGAPGVLASAAAPAGPPSVAAPTDLLTHLARLGLRLGMTVTPLMRTPGRGLVLAVGDLRLAVDRASADALRVHAPGHSSPRSTSNTPDPTPTVEV